MPESALAGLPRLVRVATELRFRGQAGLGIAVATAGFWAFSWLLDEPMHELQSLLALLVTGVPTLLISYVTAGRRVEEALRRTLPPPRGSIHETHADARDRRTRLAGIVLTGVIVLLMFDILTEGGGVMAGLVVGLFGALGLVDRIEAERWERAEQRRDARLFLLIRPHALSTRFGAAQVYELQRPSHDREVAYQPGPFDLGI
ncbi:MAG: hypothetical protein QOD86_700 [Miltoncostaeaceae bacterium]|jgi:hypothetical protein|nr:hypothetical protein [Miltoncostaeaceae bacterium]